MCTGLPANRTEWDEYRKGIADAVEICLEVRRLSGYSEGFKTKIISEVNINNIDNHMVKGFDPEGRI